MAFQLKAKGWNKQGLNVIRLFVKWNLENVEKRTENKTNIDYFIMN